MAALHGAARAMDPGFAAYLEAQAGGIHTHVLAEVQRRLEAKPAPDLIIAHSAEEGTTIRGNTRKFKDAIHALGRGFKWWRDGGRYYRTQSRGTAQPTLDLEYVADQLRAAGAVVEVEPVEVVSQEEANQIKREHLLELAERTSERAEKHEAASTAAGRRADLREEVSGIPLGQPILVGHHSERRHRAALERADRAMRKSVEESKYAARLEARAESAERRAEKYAPEATEKRLDDVLDSAAAAKDSTPFRERGIWSFPILNQKVQQDRLAAMDARIEMARRTGAGRRTIYRLGQIRRRAKTI